jgi:SAM-dependent methyltransferase
MKSPIDLLKTLYWSLTKWVDNPRKSALLLLKRQDKAFARLAARGMKWRGFAVEETHPKHLFDTRINHHLYPLFQPGIHFLDVGSGSGSACIKGLQEGVKEAIGIEYDPDNIALTHSKAKQAGVAVTILPLDLEETPYPFADNHFDLINFSDVLEHLNNRIPCLRELKRIKKPQAPIIISIPNTNTPWKLRQRRAGVDSRDDSDHKIEYSRETIAQEIAEAGLTLEGDLHPIIPSFPWNGLIAFSAVLSPRLYKRLQQWKYDSAQRHPDSSIGWTFRAV